MTQDELLEEAKRRYPIGIQYIPAHKYKETIKMVNPIQWHPAIQRKELQSLLPDDHPDKIKKEENLNGRYLKALEDDPQCIGMKKGEYVLITKDNNITRVKDNLDGFVFSKERIGTTWELMPVGFKPGQDTELSQPEKYKYEVVHCKTQEEWDFVCNVLGYKNFNTYNVYGFKSCINLNTKNYADKDGAAYKTIRMLSNGNGKAKIYSFDEWCEMTGKYPEKKTESPVKFKVGDKVKVIDQTNGWGEVNYGDIGFITEVSPNNIIYADFQNYPGWIGKEKCFELVDNVKEYLPCPDYETQDFEWELKIPLKPSECYPTDQLITKSKSKRIDETCINTKPINIELKKKSKVLYY
jgi:transcription antitermination factor NusG